jgi:HAD superfamily hydrolase (TIGR01490 family)
MPPMTNLALFDLDHTLLPVDSDHEWGRFIVRLGIVDGEHYARENARHYADYKAGCLDIQAYLRMALEPLTRHARAQLDLWHRQFMDEVISPLIRPAALELVRRHQQNGDLCCMITATNAFVTAPIARAFGFEHLIAPDPATVGGAPDGDYTGEIVGVPSYREGKVVRTESWLAALGMDWSNFERSWFYSDSLNDIPLLERVTDPVATNPDDVLRGVALSKGWRILELFKTT